MRNLDDIEHSDASALLFWSDFITQVVWPEDLRFACVLKSNSKEPITGEKFSDHRVSSGLSHSSFAFAPKCMHLSVSVTLSLSLSLSLIFTSVYICELNPHPSAHFL